MTITSVRLTAVGRLALLLCIVSMAGDLGAAGTSPLVEAVKRGDVATVRQLARNKAAVNAAEADGTTALHWAVQGNNAETGDAVAACRCQRQDAQPVRRAADHAGRDEWQRGGRGRAARGRSRRQHDHRGRRDRCC